MHFIKEQQKKCRYIVWDQVFHPTFYIFTPWLLDLFIRVPYQLHGEQTVLFFRRIELIIHIAISVLQLLIFNWVKWSMWGLSALPKDTTSKQCPNIERGETWYFSENPAPNEIRNRMAGSDIDRAARSNHCVVSRSKIKGTHESIGCCSNAWKRPMLYSVSILEFLFMKNRNGLFSPAVSFSMTFSKPLLILWNMNVAPWEKKSAYVVMHSRRIGSYNNNKHQATNGDGNGKILILVPRGTWHNDTTSRT